MYIERLDHLVLTVRDIDATIAFYRDVLGMQPQTFGEGRHALAFGQQKINLHRADGPFAPRAAHPTSGSADLCFVSSTPVREIVSQLERHGVAIEAGPVERVGALGVMDSVYFRDPDGNLIEVSKYRA
ncbi:VOC family protein [Solimonas soli]|uniref:VOC family protein n=1 Tax=Solimonas soli TaxID=413479 RepID=UPI00048081FB|nr:VOC family protein [Solimonas soli]